MPITNARSLRSHTRSPALSEYTIPAHLPAPRLSLPHTDPMPDSILCLIAGPTVSRAAAETQLPRYYGSAIIIGALRPNTYRCSFLYTNRYYTDTITHHGDQRVSLPQPSPDPDAVVHGDPSRASETRLPPFTNRRPQEQLHRAGRPQRS